MHRVVVYKSLKTMENYKTISPKCRLYKRWSFTRGSIYRAFEGDILVFWLGGRLGRLVT